MPRLATIAAQASASASSKPSTSSSTHARGFSNSKSVHGHYDTLGVPRDASKAEIKANFYKLSKQYHPDVNKASSAKSKFHAVSEAWSVLGDDAARREYDHHLDASSSRSQSYQEQRGWYDSEHDPYDPDSARRRPGATHAWETRGHGRTRYHRADPRTRREQYNPRRESAKYPWGPGGAGGSAGGVGSGGPYQYDPRDDPWASLHVRRATAQKAAEDAAREMDKLRAESGVVRFVQVLSLVLFIGVLGGGFAAH